MNMMVKIGFKPGQTLEKQRETTSSTESADVLAKKVGQNISGLKAPITVDIWEGKPLNSHDTPLSYKGLSKGKGLDGHEAPSFSYHCSRSRETCQKDYKISR